MIRSTILAVTVWCAPLAFAAHLAAGAQAPGAADIDAAIAKLGAFDFATRTQAARDVRRSKTATPALERAVRTNKDEYVRFRALVMLSGLDAESAGKLAREVVRDRNDRLRTVAYQWFEHHPDADMLPALLSALPNETSEFVRPALTRALAAYEDPRVRDVLGPLVMRGDDLFRGALIDALGDYRRSYAVPQLIDVAKRDGPLQDDAITALAKIGDARARPVLAEIQLKADAEVQPTISAASCLLGMSCDVVQPYLEKTLAFAITADDPPLLRGVVHALGMLAADGRAWALTALIEAGVKAPDAARAPIALGVGTLALRDPELILNAMASRADIAGPAELLQDAFDMLSEDFEEERFCGAVLQAYWNAPAGTPRRAAAERLIDKLEF